MCALLLLLLLHDFDTVPKAASDLCQTLHARILALHRLERFSMRNVFAFKHLAAPRSVRELTDLRPL